jgi:hypothetical protein
MLGEKIGEVSGKITGQRVLPPHEGQTRVETSFQAMGKILGADVKELGTYWSEMRAGGTVYGEGHGVFMTPDGEAASWKGSGVGRFVGKGGAVSFRGSIYIQTASAKLSRLNSVCMIFEHDCDENGNTKDQMWEWR